MRTDGDSRLDRLGVALAEVEKATKEARSLFIADWVPRFRDAKNLGEMRSVLHKLGILYGIGRVQDVLGVDIAMEFDHFRTRTRLQSGGG